MRYLMLAFVLLVAGCGDDGPTDPIGTIGGAFDLTNPSGEVLFARVTLNPYSLRYTHQRVTPDGIAETSGAFSLTGSLLSLAPDEDGPLTCDFEGYRVLHCGDGVYRMIP